MTCEYCVHIENCLFAGRIREDEIGEGGCCNEFEYGGLWEPDEVRRGEKE